MYAIYIGVPRNYCIAHKMMAKYQMCIFDRLHKADSNANAIIIII